MSTWATAAPPPKRVARRPRKNAAKEPRFRYRPKRALLPYLPYETLDLIGGYLFDAPSSKPHTPFPSSYHVRDRYPGDVVPKAADPNHCRELAGPTGLREFMALAKTCKSLNHFFGPRTKAFGGISDAKHLAALKGRISEVKYLYINSFDNTFSEDLMSVISDHNYDEALKIEEIVIKKCVHTVYSTSWNDRPLKVIPSTLKALSKCESFTMGKEVCATCSPVIVRSFLYYEKLPNLSHLRLSLPLEKLDCVQINYGYYRSRVVKHRRPQLNTLRVMLDSLPWVTSQRVKTLHLETRCERKRWGGLCQTGNSSNDPKPWSARPNSIDTEDGQEEDLEEDAEMAVNGVPPPTQSDDIAPATIPAIPEGDDAEQGQEADIDVLTEGVHSASQSDMADSTMSSPVPEADDGESDDSTNALSLGQRRLTAYCALQRRTMLVQHLDINRMITRQFKSLEELRVYRAGSSYIELMKEDEDLSSFTETFISPFISTGVKSIDFGIVLSTHSANRLPRLHESLSQAEFEEKAREAQTDLEAWRDTVMRCFIMGEAPAKPKPVDMTTVAVEVTPSVTANESTPVTEVETSIESGETAINPRHGSAHIYPAPPPRLVKVVHPPSVPSPSREQLEAITRGILEKIAALPVKPAVRARIPWQPSKYTPPPLVIPIPVIELQPTAAKTLRSWPGTVVHGRFYLPNLNASSRPKGCLHVFEWTAPALAKNATTTAVEKVLDVEIEREREERARVAASTITIKPVKLVRFV